MTPHQHAARGNRAVLRVRPTALYWAGQATAVEGEFGWHGNQRRL